MKARFSNAQKMRQKGSIVAALDIGSSKIACFIGRIIDHEGGFEVLGVGHQASQGVKSGVIVDLEAAETSIRKVVHAAENMAANVTKNFPLRDIVINIPGNHAVSARLSSEITLAGKEVARHDISRALFKAQEQMKNPAHDSIHTIPVSYQIDGQGGIRDPVGMTGQSLKMDSHIVTADSTVMQNMKNCIHRSHLDLNAVCLSSYAAGLSSLVEDEMDLGCTVIDMGGGVTSFAIFQDGRLLHADALPLGGNHVTNDIAKGLTTSLTHAERLKTLYGHAMGAETDLHEMIDVPRLGESPEDAIQHIPRSVLVGIIQPRLEEIFEHVRGRLKDSGLTQSLGRRIVLTGGASQMIGLRELVQHILDKQVRLGRPIRLSGLPDGVSGPAFATTAGLLAYLSEHSDEIPADIVAQGQAGTLWDRALEWLKENW